eukprot:4464199-Prymnesium_polylepis.1
MARREASREFSLHHVATPVKVFLRPEVEAFLHEASEVAQLVLFTSASEEYADRLRAILDPTGTLFLSVLARGQCTPLEPGVYVKDLEQLGRSLARTILIDDTKTSFLLQARAPRHGSRGGGGAVWGSRGAGEDGGGSGEAMFALPAARAAALASSRRSTGHASRTTNPPPGPRTAAQPDNGVLCKPFFGDPRDATLLTSLLPTIQRLATLPDVSPPRAARARPRRSTRPRAPCTRFTRSRAATRP